MSTPTFVKLFASDVGAEYQRGAEKGNREEHKEGEETNKTLIGFLRNSPLWKKHK